MSDATTSFEQSKQQELRQLCRERGLPLTMQRRAILQALACRRDHPTADRLYEALHEALPALSRTTVYRVLETFVQWGLIQKVESREARAHFDADCRNHCHLICLKCGQVSDFPGRILAAPQPPKMTEDGFEVIDYTVNLIGYCHRCRQRDKP
jgi:Fur family peroxide stress response transcriptional regulator